MIQKCHFIGIGGIGMSGLAKLMLERKVKVSGSDVAENRMIEGLVSNGAEVHIGHDAKYVTPGTTVVYSSGVGQENPEFQAALKMECPILHRADLLAALAREKKLLMAAGTHGKTTTAALLAAALRESGAQPSFAVGGELKQYGTNALSGFGEHFVAEADESDGSFLKYHPYGAIITNIGSDHIDAFGSREELVGAFGKFIDRVEEERALFWCGDNMFLSELSPPGISYGFCDGCALRALNFKQEGWRLAFDAQFEGKVYRDIEAPLIGAHNALNLLAVFGMALCMGVEEEALRAALKNFGGVARRCDVKEDGELMVVDDYAHHPTEISATLHAVRQAVDERRIIVAFQPHRYSRTRDCQGMYAGIFDEADEVLVTEIYGAGEEPIEGISHEEIIEESRQVSDIPCRHVPRKALLSTLAEMVRPHDVVVTMGAGDITCVGGALISEIKKKALAGSASG